MTLELLIQGIVPTNFIWSDAGRSLSKRPRQKNDCTIRALALVTNVGYDTAYDFIKSLGRKSHQSFRLGLYLNRMSKTGELVLGHRIIKHSFPAQKDKERMYVGAFCVFYPTGKFIIKQARHLAAALDGMVYDLTWDCYRCVYTAYEFEKAEADSIG
jgi:hypothetical protein